MRACKITEKIQVELGCTVSLFLFLGSCGIQLVLITYQPDAVKFKTMLLAWQFGFPPLRGLLENKGGLCLG